jgi:DNA polymerase-4
LRFHDFTRATRSHTLARPTAQTQTFLDVTRSLLAGSWPAIVAKGLTLVGVTVANLDEDDAIQLALPLAPPFGSGGADHLDAALDQVRQRYGSAAVTRAVLLGRDMGWSVPLLPD